MNKRVTCSVGGRELSIETGNWANQANGSCVVRYGDTTVLVTACADFSEAKEQYFLPLTVDYVEKTAAVGRIPGGFFKREGRPSERETLISRMIDRPLRPLFPEWYFNNTQVIATVFSADNVNDPDILALAGASCSLTISEIPFSGPIAGVRVGRKNGELLCNPSSEITSECDINIFVAGSEKAIVMVEGGSAEVKEEDMVEAILFGHESLKPILEIQNELQRMVGLSKIEEKKIVKDEAFLKTVSETSYDRIKKIYEEQNKKVRALLFQELHKNLEETLNGEQEEQKSSAISSKIEEITEQVIRDQIVKEKRRIDGRGLDDVRKIDCMVGLLPRAHGSGLFTRGETQALVTTTLGTSDDEQIIDDISGQYKKNFMLHYNFPPYSVGETKGLRGPGRREIGHGALAERAISYVIPDPLKFSYTIRVVSEVLSSNGSSSMATVCGSTLSLMDAGVPISAPVAGIAMGLLKEESENLILTDILGEEDHVGDMDFKVAGTRKGITAIQMDIKIDGVTKEILNQALLKAKAGRLHILDEMNKAIEKPSEVISPYAPKIISIYIKQDRIKDLIGPGGKNIKRIVEKSKAKIEVDESGRVNIASPNTDACDKALQLIKELTAEAEVGQIYVGVVRRIMDFGAFVEILPGTEGLVHISQLSYERVKSVSDVLKEGDQIAVKVIEIDKMGKIRLSRRDALKGNS